jgi:hypothetical protein
MDVQEKVGDITQRAARRRLDNFQVSLNTCGKRFSVRYT